MQWILRSGMLLGVAVSLFAVALPAFAADPEPATSTPDASVTVTVTPTAEVTPESPATTLTPTEAVSDPTDDEEDIAPSDDEKPDGILAPQQVRPRAYMAFATKRVPGPFGKDSPTASATGIPATGVILSWTVSQMATVYDVCLSLSVVQPCVDGTGFTRLTISPTHALNTGALTPGQVYFWHVRARSPGGVTYSDGGLGQTRMFVVTPLPGPLNKVNPSSGTASHPATGITLTWTAAANAVGYAVCLSTNFADCTNPVLYNRNAGAHNFYATGPLQAGIPYYWNVRAYNNNGPAHVRYANENINQVWSFTTRPLPQAFNKIEPASGTAPSTVVLSWGPSVGATSYELCVDADPARCVGGGGGFTISTQNTTYTPGGLTPNTTYFWHVRAVNPSGAVYSNNSIGAIWNFLAPIASGGTDPCSAGTATQNTDYSAQQNRADFYYAIVVNQASTVNLNVTGATGQIQLRTPNLSACPNHTTTLVDFRPTPSGAASLTYFNVTPGRYYVRIVTQTPGSNTMTFRWSATPGYTYYEPNNTACAPTSISVGTNYTAYPENSRPDLDLGSGVGAENDYYQFTVGASTAVQIQFSGYTAIKADGTAGERQVQLRGGSCGSTGLVDGTAFVANATSGNIQRTLAAGTYWVRFVTVNGTQSNVAYTFNVGTGTNPGNGNGVVDTCIQPSAHCDWQTDDPNDAYPPPVTMYWWNMEGKAWLQLWLTGQDNAQCGKGGSSPSITINNPQPNSSYRFTGVSNGYYHFSAKWSPVNPNGSDGDSKALKVNCTQLSAVPSLLPEPPEVLGPPGIIIVPADTAAQPRPTPIPLPDETPTPTPTPEPTMAPGQIPTPVP